MLIMCMFLIIKLVHIFVIRKKKKPDKSTVCAKAAEIVRWCVLNIEIQINLL